MPLCYHTGNTFYPDNTLLLQKGKMERAKEKRKVTPEHAMKLLAENGTIISLTQAKLIVDLMYKFGAIALRPHTNPKSP